MVFDVAFIDGDVQAKTVTVQGLAETQAVEIVAPQREGDQEGNYQATALGVTEPRRDCRRL